MVVAIKEQQPKKSKLSLFRLGKSSSSKPSAAPLQAVNSYDPRTDTRAYAAGSYSSNTYPSERSIPQQMVGDASSSTNRIQKSAHQAANQGANSSTAVHYQFPESTGLPRNSHHAVSSSPDQYRHQEVESQYRRIRADSLPLQGFFHPEEQHFAAEERTVRPNVRALDRIQNELTPTSRHSRQRSHFSIPDVIVTTCEEEGQEQLVEIEIPANKRRSYMLRDTSEESLQDQRSHKKSNPGFARRPAPLIRFDTDEIKAIGMPRSGSVPSISSVSSAGSPIDCTAASTSTAASSASSTLSKASLTKRGRKPSFPLLFGRKAVDSSKSNAAAEQMYVEEPLPYSPITPTSAPASYGDSFRSTQPDGLLFSSHGPPSPVSPPLRNIFSRAISGLPSPPVTPTSPPKSASRKQMKAKAKEELALIKELERVDKLVKQHDDKARKEREKSAAKDRKRAAKVAQMNSHSDRHSAETRPSVDTFTSGQSVSASRGSNRTIFKASTKTSAAPGLGRRASIRGAPADARAAIGERRGSEPALTRSFSPTEARANVSSPFSVDLPAGDRLPFTQPRAAPRPVVASEPSTQTAPLSLAKQAVEGRTSVSKDRASPPRPTRPARPAPPVPAPTAMPVNLVHEPVVEPKLDSVDTSISEDADVDDTEGWKRQSFSELNSGLAGRLPSLIHTNNAVARSAVEQDSGQSPQAGARHEMDEERRAKLARRASVQRVLALSDAEGARLQKRASLRKRGSQQQLKRSHHDEALSGVVSNRSSAASLRQRSLVRPIPDDVGWDVGEHDEWVEDDKQVEVEVDLVLADLRRAQHAGLRKHIAEDEFRLSLALTPLHLQPFEDLDKF